MTNIVVNGAPHNLELGIKDSSRVRRQRERVPRPQHLPKVYLFAERGKQTEWMGAGVERERRYGAKTFQPRSKWFNHSTQLSNVVNAQGNICMYKRVVPDDAGPAANICVWLDVLETQVDLYERNADGSIRTVNGQPVITGQHAGFKWKYVVTTDTTISSSDQNFGTREIGEGDQIDPTNPANRSVRYPIMEFRANSRGAWGNNIGFRIWAMDERLDVLPEKMIAREKAFPFRFQLVERDPAINAVNILNTVMVDASLMFTTKPFTVDPSTNKDIYFGDQFPFAYQETDLRYPLVDAPLDSFTLYQENIDLVTKQFFDVEKTLIDPAFHDFTAADDDVNLFNIFSGRTLKGQPYHTYVPVTGGVNFNRYETIYCQSGSDGTLSLENFEALVVNEVRRYLDESDFLQEKVVHLESQLYDSGYSMETKLELAAFIAVRKDTFVTYGTFQEGERDFDNSEKLSIAQTLKARLMNLPESTYFGTEVTRAGIYAGSCELRNNPVANKRVSTVMEVAHKRAKYMGAGNGRWTTQMEYDRGAPGSLCEITTKHDQLWVPRTVRYRFWDAGLNWFGYYDKDQPFCPAFRTVYSDETSLLTADSFVQCLLEINKINDRSWREVSGTVGESDDVFTERVENWIRNEVRDKFDNRFPIEPECTITEADRARGGISWHSNIKVYGDPMRTVAITYTEALRNESRTTN